MGGCGEGEGGGGRGGGGGLGEGDGGEGEGEGGGEAAAACCSARRALPGTTTLLPQSAQSVPQGHVPRALGAWPPSSHTPSFAWLAQVLEHATVVGTR
jgi:hypothetical protein